MLSSLLLIALGAGAVVVAIKLGYGKAALGVTAAPAESPTPREGGLGTLAGDGAAPRAALAPRPVGREERKQEALRKVVLGGLGIGLGVLYIICPIDLIPDFIPFLGWADDAGMLVVVVKSIMRYCAGKRELAALAAEERAAWPAVAAAPPFWPAEERSLPAPGELAVLPGSEGSAPAPVVTQIISCR